MPKHLDPGSIHLDPGSIPPTYLYGVYGASRVIYR